jgi:hypothetical protein
MIENYKENDDIELMMKNNAVAINVRMIDSHL